MPYLHTVLLTWFRTQCVYSDLLTCRQCHCVAVNRKVAWGAILENWNHFFFLPQHFLVSFRRRQQKADTQYPTIWMHHICSPKLRRKHINYIWDGEIDFELNHFFDIINSWLIFRLYILMPIILKLWWKWSKRWALMRVRIVHFGPFADRSRNIKGRKSVLTALMNSLWLISDFLKTSSKTE